MKNLSVLPFFICLIFSCKPEIKIIDFGPDKICSCISGDIRYQITDADRFWVEIIPASSAPGGISDPTTNHGITTSRFQICDNATIHVFAENRNGRSEAIKEIRKAGATEIQSLSGMLSPLCFGNVFQGWDFVITTELGAASVIAVDAVLQEIIINVDRNGSFTYDGITIPVVPGMNRLTGALVGHPSHHGNYRFTAPLNFREECAESGTSLPSGRVPPPSFTINILARCPE
ncbi:MAG: hypothetical protein ABI851_01240 [Saprospiraceae bacterium]